MVVNKMGMHKLTTSANDRSETIRGEYWIPVNNLGITNKDSFGCQQTILLRNTN